MEKCDIRHKTALNGGEINNQLETKMKLENVRGFRILLTCTQIVGAVFVVLLTLWRVCYGEGFGWRNPISTKIQYNWHPLLTTIGMVYLFGTGLLTYRSFRGMKKRGLKNLHALVLFAAFLLSVVGLVAVIDSKNFANPPKHHFFSLHSWFGIVAFIGFTAQWVAGFVTFLYPGLSGRIRVASLPFHVNFGLVLFIMACISAMLGFPKQHLWSSQPQFGFNINFEAVLVNAMGVLLFLFAFLVVFLVTRSYKRLPEAKD